MITQNDNNVLNLQLFGSLACHKTKEYIGFLEKNGVKFEYYDVKDDLDAAEKLKKLFKSDELKFPTFILNDRIIRNPTIEKLEKQLERNELIPRKLRHDSNRQWLYFVLPNEDAYISYKKTGNLWILNHSYVPVLFRGKGIASNLVKQTFDFLIRENIKIEITCSYIMSVFKKNENEYRDLLHEI